MLTTGFPCCKYTTFKRIIRISLTFDYNEIIGGNISRITGIFIEFAGYHDKSVYLNDRTAFDAFIEYKSSDGQNNGIGIEVKYTENSYPLGIKERKDIENPNGLYQFVTKKCGYYNNDMDITMFLQANHLRQIWRNHILGFAMILHRDINHFHHIHLYPRQNKHFQDYALPEYESLLSNKGKDSFIELTYEKFFKLLTKNFTSTKQKEWTNYLYKRYLDL